MSKVKVKEDMSDIMSQNCSGFLEEEMFLNTSFGEENLKALLDLEREYQNERTVTYTQIISKNKQSNDKHCDTKIEKHNGNMKGKKQPSVGSKLKLEMRRNIKQTISPEIERFQDSCSGSFIATQLPSVRTQSQTEHGFFGLPSSVPKLLFEHRGITELYEWQKECLNLEAIRDQRNLVYSLPTSGGKTLVAEILIFKELLCNNKNAIIVLPYISIVQEKVHGLSPFAVDLDFLVEEYAASKGQLPPKSRHRRHSIFVATIEKASLLINSLFESGRIDEVGLVIIDELHLLCEGGHRGAVLEMMLTKLKCYAAHIQIIGMSATLPNMTDILTFLNAESFVGSFRPVELKEYLKVGDEIFSVSHCKGLEHPDITLHRKLDFKYSPQMKLCDPEYLLGILSEVIPNNSCLVFCPTKKHCENLVKFVAQNLPKEHFTEKLFKEKKALINALLMDGAGKICPILQATIPFGLAYHHSGLTMDERRMIEEAYSAGTLCCLACTSTLAAGVNLPAKRVIIRAPFVGIKKLSASEYRQMVGRAGRAGFDTSGESILMLKSSETKDISIFLNNTQPSSSTLVDINRKSLSILILSLIGLQLAVTTENLKYFMTQTLYGIQNDFENVMCITKDIIKEFRENNLIRVKNNEKYYVTPLGQAAFKSGIDIKLALKIYNDLHKGLASLVLTNHLHLLYIVTPYENLDMVPIQSDIYFNAYMSLNTEEQHTAGVIGITESYIGSLMSGINIKNVDKLVVQRFYVALILYGLWQHSSIWEVSKKFDIHRGTVNSLLNSVASFASCICRFCEELNEFWPYTQLLPNFTKQLYYCCSPELLPLMELPAVKQGRARQLYNAGYKSLADLAKASAIEMVKTIDHMSRKVANEIIATAKMILLEKAESLREEVEDIMMGLDAPSTMNKENCDPVLNARHH